MAICEVERPLYTIHYYSEFVYKVVKFKRSGSSVYLGSSEDREEARGKFSQALSRARSMLLQYALCNKWDYFITVTVNPDRFHREDLPAIRKYLSQWFRDYRKEWGAIKYVLVPELHKKGGWHFHGFISGIAPQHITRFVAGIHPFRLVHGDYYNFPRLSQAIGFVSLSPVLNPIGAAFYMTKYITKDIAVSGYYDHLYYVCRGLNTARPVADVYQYSQKLEDSFYTPCIQMFRNLPSVL